MQLRYLLVASFLAASPVLVHAEPRGPVASTPAQDPLVAKAVQRIAEVEKAEASLAEGDKAGANKLINRLNWAGKRLGAVVQQGSSEWKTAKKRYDDVLAKIEKKRDAKPKPKPSTGGGGTPPKTPPKPAPKPSPNPTPKKKYDHEKVVRLNEDVSRAFENIKIIPMKLFLDANRVQGLEGDLAKFRERLAAFPEDHDNVKIVKGNVDNFEKLLRTATDKIAKDREAAPPILERLETIWDKYDEEKYPIRIHSPFNETQLRSWAHEIRLRRDEKIPSDLAWLETWKDNVAVGANRYQSAYSNLTFSVRRQLEEAESGTTQVLDSQSADAVRVAEWVLETDVTDRNQVIGRVLGEGRFDENMLRLREGLESIRLAKLVDEELGRKDGPDRSEQKAKVEKAAEHFEKLARVALSEVRMPEPVSEDAELLEIAKDTLELEKYEIEGWERLVINAPLEDHNRREAWFRSSGTRGVIEFYDYTWKQFQVTTAERVDGEIWLFANTLKRYSSGDPTTPVDAWILSRRFKLTPILEENLQ